MRERRIRKITVNFKKDNPAMKQINKTRRFLIGLFSVISVFTFILEASAQGNQAIVIMRSGNASTTNCDGTAEMNYQIVSDIKLNTDGEIRLFNAAIGEGTSPDSMNVSRKSYEDAPKNKLVNLYALKWQNNFLTALSASGQTPFLVLPENMKPQKNLDSKLSSFYSVMLAGESREGKQKRKISLALRDVWKIYFVQSGGNFDDVLFKHAVDEKSVVVWEAFLKKTSNYRQADANTNMRDVMITCARVSLDQFAKGDYKALEIARQRTERAQSVRGDDVTAKLLVEINQHKQRVNSIREQVSQLLAASRFDEAITAAEPIKIYLSNWNDLNTLYNEALKQSHEQHLAKGEQALQSNQLDAALKECEIAWSRLNDSTKARGCVCMSRNRIALRDSNNFRQRKQPKLAKELLEKQLADSDCSREEAVLKELTDAKREYSQQLFNEALQLTSGGGKAVVKPASKRKTTAASNVGGLKTVVAQNKPAFREAREKLFLAEEMSPAENAKTLLGKVNQSLSGFCQTEARKALQRNDSGTAYVYLMSAQNYTPENNDVNTLLNQAREQFEEKTRVSIGVVFVNKAGYRNAESVLNNVSSEIESIATRVGLAQPVILDRSQSANAWRAIQGNANLPSPTAIFSGDLLGANVTVNAADRRVRSYYTEENPEWKQRDVQHDAISEQYKSCKKVSGEAACANLKSRRDELRRYRDSVEHYPKYYYDYSERHFKVSGSARLSFRYADSISRSVRAAETLTAAVADECVARNGVDERDRSARNNDCNQIQDESGYLDKLTNQLKADASSRAYTLLRDLPVSYLKRAKTAANRQQSVEDYLRFLFLTSEKTGDEALESKKFLLAFDPELKTDGVLR